MGKQCPNGEGNNGGWRGKGRKVEEKKNKKKTGNKAYINKERLKEGERNGGKGKIEHV